MRFVVEGNYDVVYIIFKVTHKLIWYASGVVPFGSRSPQGYYAVVEAILKSKNLRKNIHRRALRNNNTYGYYFFNDSGVEVSVKHAVLLG